MNISAPTEAISKAMIHRPIAPVVQ